MDDSSSSGKGKELSKEDCGDGKKGNIVFTYIMLLLFETVKGVVRKCKTARETWTMLESNHGGKDVGDRLELRQRLRDIKFKRNDSMMNHLSRIQYIADQLAAAGGELPEEDIILTILQS